MNSRTFFLAFLFVVLTSAVFAQPSGVTQMLGPNTPARADTNADGTASNADAPIIPTRVGASIVLTSPWQSAFAPLNTFNLSNMIGGKFHTVSRFGGGGLQEMTVTGFTAGTPSAFSGQENGSNGLVTGSGVLLDGNNDGIFDGITGSSSNNAINFSLNFVHVDTNDDGFADYISIPWAQANMAGVNFNNTVGGRNPQVWVPMADTNGDGRGDSIVPDFDGDTFPDIDLLAAAPNSFGPITAPASLFDTVPTLSQWVMLLMLMTLSVLALLQLRRWQGGATSA